MMETSRAFLARISTPISEMVAVATESHLLMFEFERRKMYAEQLERVRKFAKGEIEEGESPVFGVLRTQLDEYFRGDRREFDLPLHVPGTEFQTRVWNALRQIPCGTTTSYARLAESIGQPNAVRAVARANGENRMAIIIPCHRVIGSDGTLVGYGGGLWRKRKLLDLEARDATLPLFA
jgi:AraC family transcriptional regulator, regulatory protein of adaptative response / methylated-DNA-[protein]-cysteine methyltransferase